MDLFDFTNLPDILTRLGNNDITDAQGVQFNNHFVCSVPIQRFVVGGEKIIREADIFQETLTKFFAPTREQFR